MKYFAICPVCGNTSARIDGKDYNIPFHGFAKDNIFSLKIVKATK